MGAVAISFWIISISMVASTVFFLMESMNVSAHWKTSLNCGALVTLVAAGYAGEAQFVPAMLGFVLGMCGWGFILFEIFANEAGKVAADIGKANKYVQQSFSTMRFIVTVGWSIYPLGYFFGYLLGSVNDSTLNLVYNLADFVNKIAFVLAIWSAAKSSTMESQAGALLA